WCQLADVGAAATALLASGHGPANELALRYRNAMLERRLSAATVNRRLAALRSLVQLAHTLGLVPWGLAVPGVRAEAYRSTTGPGKKAFRKMLDRALLRTDVKGRRDLAILRLLHDLGLRREEVCRLDVEDFDRDDRSLAVLGKGKTEKVR